MSRPSTLAPLLVFAMSASLSFGAPVAPSEETVLDTLHAGHPRLFLREAQWTGLKTRIASDATLRGYYEDVLAAADRYCTAPTLEYRKITIRLLHVSRECLDRTQALGMAWRLTGDPKYARAARDNLLAVCAFPDWNPSHFLDTAEMSHAVGVGYDWLYDWLDEATRATLREGLIRHGMKPGLDAYARHWFVRNAFNWNQVCNGGLVVGALAIADTHPEYARQMVPKAVVSLQNPLKTYEPDGAWGEGVGYWNYATSYTVYALAAMQSALDTDYGLSEMPGLAKAAEFPLALTGPTGLYLNYADIGGQARRGPLPCLFWLAGRYRQPAWSDAEHALLAGGRRAGANHLLFYQSPTREKVSRPLDTRFRGPVEVAVMRSAWDDPNALFVGVKAGYNRVAHGHLDLGNFELDALGARWARDLGADDYNLPAYFGNRRWSYYRLNSQSHNVPLLDGRNQHLDGKASITRFDSKEDRAFAILDLSSAYVEGASRVLRGVALIEGRRAALIQDEFRLARPCEVAWGMTTDASIQPSGATAVLKQNGRQLTARILSPAGASWSVESAEQAPPQAANKGVSRLIVRFSRPAGDVRVAVLLSPQWEDGETVERVPVKPLADW
ncbi:heparinase II/III family protein [bacterium]|nr:heparinase II/III family protein [bacterium]